MSTAQTLEVRGYQVMQFLGSGARSTIWQIRNRRTDELFALKRVVKRQASDVYFLQQAINEYNVGHRLNHPVVRHIYHIRRVKRWLSLREIHLVMELCNGYTIQEQRPKDVTEVVRVFIEVAKALTYMNANGFVHADMKPNNIIVADDGTVKIIDLGQSCPMGAVKQRIQGTPDFIAPEQVHRHSLDARTDVFNLGASLYWTLTGRAIPTALPKQNAATLITDATLVPLTEINPDVPSPLVKLVNDSIQANPSHRPGSMNDVLSRLNLISHTLQSRKPGTQDNRKP
ncbi:MAG: serine/threonine-protein kinase [Planctomycetota bacterium]|nr:serine/threonine-protein kinase [Planctomycetota bacterium]